MKALILLLLSSACEVFAGQGGGIKMKIGQHGFNEVLSYLLNHELIPYLQNDLDLGEQNFEIGPNELHANKVRLHQLEGQYGNVTVSSGNKLRVTAGFSLLALAANLTHFSGQETIKAPNTIVYFYNCWLDVVFLLGSEQNKDGVAIDNCKASIGDLKAEGNLKHALEGVFEIAGDTSIASLVEKFCPYLENITNERFNDILSVQDTISISSSTVGDVLVNMKLLSLSAEHTYTEIAVEVTSGTDQFVGNVKFPPLDLTASRHDVVILINDVLLSKVCELAIQNATFNALVFEKMINQETYRVVVDKKTINGTVISSEEGSSVIWNATFDVTTGGGSCTPYQISMDSVIPFVFDYNDTILIASVDRDRLQMEYQVSTLDQTCAENVKTVEATKDVQLKLLQETNSELETLLKGKQFSLKLPKDKWYGFKEAHIKAMTNGLAFSFGMRVGEQTNVKEEDLKSIHNKHYDGKVISYRYSDGQTVEVNIPITTTSAPISATSVPFISIFLMVVSVFLVCFLGN